MMRGYATSESGMRWQHITRIGLTLFQRIKRLKGSRSVSRQEKILQILVAQKTISINELARELDVSGWTVRRELNKMTKQQIVERGHGTVTLVEEPESLSLLMEMEISIQKSCMLKKRNSGLCKLKQIYS